MIRSCSIALGSLLSFAALSIGVMEVRADDAQERAAITKMAQAFVDAYAKEDAAALAAFWTPDGDYMDLSGKVLKGRAAIAEDFAHLFKENDGLALRIEIALLQFPTADTAIEDGVTSVLSKHELLPNRARYTNFLVKQNGKWLLSSVRESAFVPPNNFEHLRPLEWLIGEWVEDGKEDYHARVLIEWTPDQNFIIATRAVGVQDLLLDNGSQRIGWDPSAKALRSWSFESDGGFSEGVWIPDGDNRWANRVSAVMASGDLMISTTIVTRIDADTLTWQSVEQQVNGKALPDSPVITMKRVN